MVPMRFSIITPSFRGGQWLRLCIASVADQGVHLEHIVQDAVSDDGTLDWLTTDARVRARVEQDRGMYDALNKGFRASTGEILAWLNCDEQYLPSSLAWVEEQFRRDPDLDVLFGDVVMIGVRGEYLWHRKMQVPLRNHTWTCHLSTLSCATFFRRRVLFDYGCFFDPQLRAAGDGEWMLRLLRKRVRMASPGRFTSAFTQTGANLSRGVHARQEARQLYLSAPAWIRLLKPIWIAHHRLRRWFGGMYQQAPFSYEVFTPNSPERRVRYQVPQPGFRP